MKDIKCPLCCQLSFNSIKTLQEHLQYYTFRPIVCIICELTCHGVIGYISHIESHVPNTTKYMITDESDILKALNESNPVSKSSFSPDNDILPRSEPIEVQENIQPTFRKNKIIYKASSESANRSSCSTNIVYEAVLSENTYQSAVSQDVLPVASFDINTPRIQDLPSKLKDKTSVSTQNLQIRAYRCEHCGLKIVGTDTYCSHLQKEHSADVASDKSTTSLLLSLQKLIKSCPKFTPPSHVLPNSKTCSQPKVDEEDPAPFPTEKENCTETIKDVMMNNPPYIHKKFEYDRDRQTEVRVQRCEDNYQSFLLDRLNESLTKEVPNEVDASLKRTDGPCHINNIVRGGILPEIVSKCYACIVCKKIFEKQSLRTNHIKEVHVGKQFCCRQCNVSFRSKRDLVNHEGMHANKLKRCSSCSYSCHTSSALRTHIFEKHSANKKRYKCSLCEDTFLKKYGLNRHVQRIHGDSKFVCDYCGKSYRWQDDINKHTCTHSNNGYQCEDCSNTFKSSFALKRHIASVHKKVDSYSCEYCRKTFPRKDGLKKHVKLHKRVYKFDNKKY